MTFVKGTNTKFTRGDFSWNCSRDVWGGQSDGFRMIRVRLGSREGIGRSYCGLWGTLCNVHCISCVVKYGLVWYSLVWHGYRGVIAGQAEKGEQRFMGGSRGRLGLPSPGMSVMSQDRDSAQVVYL